MATKTVKYSKTNIADLPNDLSVLYRIVTASGGLNYIGVAARRKVTETILAHVGKIPGVKVKIEQFATVAEARKKQKNVLKRSGSKYN